MGRVQIQEQEFPIHCKITALDHFLKEWILLLSVTTSSADFQHHPLADRQAHVCLQELGGAINKARTTAHWLLDDCTQIWQEFGRLTTMPVFQGVDTTIIPSLHQVAAKGTQETETQAADTFERTSKQKNRKDETGHGRMSGLG